jgi:hypothetical protein
VFESEPLPVVDAAEATRRRRSAGFFRWLLSSEDLPALQPAVPDRRGLLGWVLERETLEPTNGPRHGVSIEEE